MIIQLKPEIQSNHLANIQGEVQSLGYQSNPVKTQEASYLVCIGKSEFDIRKIGQLEGVLDIHRVSDDHKLTSHKWKVERAVIDLGDGVKISHEDFAIMAGPCSIEGEEQIQSTVDALVANGVRIMRGGVYKPRSSPYNFRGLGMEGLKLFYQLCSAKGIKIITEVMQVSQLEEMYPYVDIFQVGARNSQNFNLLDALGEIDKPVLIKRGISGTIDELLHSAEYVFANGNERLLLCERGIRTHEKAYRNTLDLNAVPILKEKTYLPVIVDPSHGIGIRRFVEPMALAAVAAGADGLIIEMHEKPEKALTDAAQTIDYTVFADIVRKSRALRESMEM